MHDLNGSIFLQSEFAELNAETGALHAAEGREWLNRPMVVYPRRAAFQPSGNSLCLLRIRGPGRAAEADVEAVRALNRGFEIGVADHRQDRPELLLVDDAHAIRCIRDDGHWVEESGTVRRFAAR